MKHRDAEGEFDVVVSRCECGGLAVSVHAEDALGMQVALYDLIERLDDLVGDLALGEASGGAIQ